MLITMLQSIDNMICIIIGIISFIISLIISNKDISIEPFEEYNENKLILILVSILVLYVPLVADSLVDIIDQLKWKLKDKICNNIFIAIYDIDMILMLRVLYSLTFSIGACISLNYIHSKSIALLMCNYTEAVYLLTVESCIQMLYNHDKATFKYSFRYYLTLSILFGLYAICSSLSTPTSVLVSTIILVLGSTCMLTRLLLLTYTIAYKYKFKLERSTSAWALQIATYLYLGFVVIHLITLLSLSVVYGQDQWYKKTSLDKNLKYTIVCIQAFSILFYLYFFIISRVYKKAAFLNIASLDVKRSFVRYVSHELRTPLNCVKLGLELSQTFVDEMPKNTKNKSETLDSLLDASSSCSCVVEILNDLLLYETIIEDGLDLNLGHYEGLDIVKESIHQMKLRALSSGVNFLLEASSIINQSVNLYCDKVKILQVLRNLLSNACKFSTTGSNIDIIVTIVDNDDEAQLPILQKDYYANISASASFSKVLPVNVAWAGKYFKIEVVDKGIGISLENQKKLFKNTVQFDSLKSQNGGGNGLGLYISNTILEKHYGRIGVYSEGINGNGSSFYLELPIFSIRKYSVIEKSSSSTALMTNFNDGESLEQITNPALMVERGNHEWNEYHGHDNLDIERPSEKDNHKNSISSSSVISKTGYSYNILVVDDSLINRKLVGKAVLFLSYCNKVMYACDGKQALDLMAKEIIIPTNSNNHRNSNIDIILLDYSMPVMIGPHFAQEVRKMGYSALIVGLTGNAFSDDKEIFLKSGVNCVLTKPLDVSELDKIIKKFYNMEQ